MVAQQKLLFIILFFSFLYVVFNFKKRFYIKKDTIVQKILSYYHEPHSGNITCYIYKNGTNHLQELDEMEPGNGTNIFFLDTYCHNDISDIELFSRQACSIESALLAHPNSDVFLLVLSPVKVNYAQTQNVLIKTLLGYSNFKIRHINFERYLRNTPLQNIYDSKLLFTSQWPVSHASDVLRFATLYKFSGLYLDTDVIVLKSLANISNYVGAETKYNLGSGILNFGPDKVGREVAADCAEELSSTFNGNIWGYNGPQLISRVLKRRCNVTKIPEMKEENCEGFHVHPESSFTPVNYSQSLMIFENGKSEELNSLISESYTIHVWNKITGERFLYGTDIPYLKLAEKNCPKIFETRELV